MVSQGYLFLKDWEKRAWRGIVFVSAKSYNDQLRL